MKRFIRKNALWNSLLFPREAGIIILKIMSLAKILFDGLGWSEFSHILLFLNLNELWLLGKCNRFAFLVFLKEKSFRKSENFKNVIYKCYLLK